MFYVIVALWAVGCVACWLLRRVQKKVLTATCIAIPVVGASVSLVLINTYEKGMAIAVILLSVYIFIIFMSALLTYRTNQQHPGS